MPASLFHRLLRTSTLLLCLGTATGALAHAHLQSATPASGSQVGPTQELRLVFSEGVEEKFTNVAVRRDNALLVLKSIATAPGDKQTLIVTPEQPLTAGDYVVEWQAVSVDTHKSSGNYSFKVMP